MIDTSKYEGHRPAPWNITVSAFKGKYILEEATNPTCANEVCANADLMQDAPLLLAEVKRLREAIVDMVDSMDNYYIRDIQHATECLRDMIGYYEDEEE